MKTIRKLRLSAATGLAVLLIGGGVGAALATDPSGTGVEATDSNSGQTGVEATDSNSGQTGVEAVGVGHEDPAGDVNHEFNGEE